MTNITKLLNNIAYKQLFSYIFVEFPKNNFFSFKIHLKAFKSILFYSLKITTHNKKLKKHKKLKSFKNIFIPISTQDLFVLKTNLLLIYFNLYLSPVESSKFTKPLVAAIPASALSTAPVKYSYYRQQPQKI